MITQLVLLTRRSDMSRQEMSDYWKNVHGPIAEKMPNVHKYVQYHTKPEGGEAYDGIALLQFDDEDAMNASWGSPEGKATSEDIPKFLDPNKVVIIVTEAHEVV